MTAPAAAQRVALLDRQESHSDLLSRPAKVLITSLPLDVALTELQRVTGIPLAFSPTFLPISRMVSCRCELVTVQQALDSLLAGTNLQYTELRGQIIIERLLAPPVDRRLEPLNTMRVVPAAGIQSLRSQGGREALSSGALNLRDAPQGGPVGGIVVVSGRATPLAGARVVLVGTTTETRTNAAGRFRFENLAGASVSLQVTMIGYRPMTAPARVGDVAIRVAMTEMPINLDELIVTGTPGAVQRRAIGNSVANIDAASVTEVMPTENVGQLVNGRAAGVVVVPATGMVGSGPIIRIRGTSTVSLNSEPLIYIDGVRADNSVRTGPDFQGAAVISRLNDINPQDIESIQIIKGPAAATLYGTEASNGVIQIITKKGIANQPATYNLNVRQGANWFMNPEGRILPNYLKLPSGEIIKQDLVAQENERGAPIFHNGWVQGYGLNVAGGSNILRYYLGTGYDQEEGILDPNVNKRLSGRTNISVVPNAKIDITASAGYVHENTRLAPEDFVSLPFSLIFGDPSLRNTSRRGFVFAPPEVFPKAFDLFQGVDRFTGSLQINHRPAKWLTQRLTVGVDQISEDNHALTERDPTLEEFFGSDVANGTKSVLERALTTNTVDYSATITLGLGRGIQSSTSAGGQYYRNFTKTFTAIGRGFPAPGLSTVNAAAITTGGDDFVENTTVGTYVQEQLSFKDRLFLTGAVRADDNSAFGTNFDFATYPKASATWVVSEEPFWHLKFINTLRLRAAYGASGQQPAAFASLRTFVPVTGEGSVPSVTTGLVGNPDLAPERGVEFEAGLDGGLFNDRVSIEFTYYNKTTKDAILLRSVAPSTGFFGSQFVNVGKVKNKGFEVLVTAVPVESRSLNWSMSFSLAGNNNKILDLGGLPTISLVADIGRHQVGYPISGFFAKKVVSARFDAATGRAVDILCDDGAGSTAACSSAPKVFVGRRDPKLDGAFNSRLTLFDRLQLRAQVDFKTGYKIFGVDHWLRCAILSLCEEAVYPERFDPILVADVQNANGFGQINSFISNASFAKLRELSVTYSLPATWARAVGASRGSITIAGRNLHTWTKYDAGLDPENRALRFTDLNIEQAQLPQLAQFVAGINLTF